MKGLLSVENADVAENADSWYFVMNFLLMVEIFFLRG